MHLNITRLRYALTIDILGAINKAFALKNDSLSIAGMFTERPRTFTFYLNNNCWIEFLLLGYGAKSCQIPLSASWTLMNPYMSSDMIKKYNKKVMKENCQIPKSGAFGANLYVPHTESPLSEQED